MRWESGETEPQPWFRPRLARALKVSSAQLDDLLTDSATSPAPLMGHPGTAGLAGRTQLRVTCLAQPGRPPRADDIDLSIVCRGRRDLPEIDDMNRRELLRLFTMAGTLLAMPPIEDALDTDRITYVAGHPSKLSTAALDEYAQLNSHLWRVFALASSKSDMMPLVRRQLDMLSTGLQQPHSIAVHHRLCVLAGDLFQLAGEIFFDGNHYTDAAQCYTLAATASKEASAFDLWACAITRHAFIAVYEQQFDKAAPMLELAAALARRGDSTLSTRHWVSAVQAETFAGLGDLDTCQRALHAAEQVRELDGPAHNGGWLRFDGSRLAEERGTCYVMLGSPDLAETALTDALRHSLSPRRCASVLTDLAMIGVQRCDPDQVVAYANAALDTARRTGSGVISRKLRGLQPHLAPLRGDSNIHRLDDEITALAGPPIGR